MTLYFEDFYVGRRFETKTVEVTEAEIVAFAERYAPLPYHTDAEAAKASVFGGLVAPGHLTSALAFGLLVRTGALSAAGMGSPGIDRLRWLAPVRPGDRLRVVATVSEVSPARAPGGRDAVRLDYETINQDGTVVMRHSSLHFLRRRPPGNRDA